MSNAFAKLKKGVSNPRGVFMKSDDEKLQYFVIDSL